MAHSVAEPVPTIAPLSPPSPPPTDRPLHTLPAPFTTSNLQLLAQGAEALVYKTTFLTPNTPCVVKYRPPKPYRHPILDKRLTKARLLAEARVLVRAGREGVSVPRVLGADWEGGWLVLSWVGGGSVRQVLDGWAERVKRGEQKAEQALMDGEILDLMRRIGRCVGRLHDIGISHGDLTTSNIMLQSPSQESGPQPPLGGEITLIDFGLASHITPNSADEEGAVDLYVLERAFAATHPAAEPLFQEVLKAYSESWKGAKSVMKRLEDVRLRGRKRSMLG
ncbi:kinase-like protein [Massarina eburnea CBS 473.64]|uniref:EKC/KEOPS complex subunit BUD32 n=1 Tax=Massarina eburnea CBS 473.64 TaxID=1395130 RepID=A0A6A6SAH8_9PLEO|nr:kinase-like protein [Massarina eburnea CBS 473.64]